MQNVIKTGEKPGYGTYSCTNCGQNVDLNKGDKMPPLNIFICLHTNRHKQSIGY